MDKKTELAQLKKKFGRLYEYTSDDGKYVVYLRRPSRSEYSIFQTQVQAKGFFEAVADLIEDLIVKGDKAIVENDDYFYSLATTMDEIMTTVTGSLKKI